MAFAALPGCGRARLRQQPNLVLISIDTLRADRVSPATTPRLDAWARRHATTFRQAIAQAPWTLPSHASLLTGLDPLRHAANRSHYPLPAGVPTLAEKLRAGGYSTAAITGGAWLDPAYGLLRGFERVQAWSQRGRGDVEWERHAALAATWLDELPQPFFLFVHTYDVHDFPRAPRLPPNTPDEERARAYDAAVRHMDAHLAPLLARLSADALRARTAVVVTSDHGEALGEPTAEGARDYGHGSLRDAVLRVPLLVALPRDARFRPRRVEALVPFVEQQVRLVDVAPTFLELAGAGAAGPAAQTRAQQDDRRNASTPPTAEEGSVRAWSDPALDGASLLPLLRGEQGAAPRPALSYFARPGHGLALRDQRFKYTFDDAALTPAAAAAGGSAHPETPREALFDLAADAGETRNLAPDHAHVATWRALARRLIEERTAGLALRLRAGRAPARLLLRGPLVDGGAPTSPVWPGPALRRAGHNAAEVQLPARGEVTLLFQPTGDTKLTIDLAGVQATLDPPSQASPVALRFDGKAWSPALVGRAAHQADAGVPKLPSSPCPAAVCAQLAWSGRAPWTGRASAVPVDAALRERLRALGYVQ